ncbi:MAG: HEAT repeat domain-containing protein [Dehalococcoidia bacterium]
MTTPDSSITIERNIERLVIALTGNGVVAPWNAREALEDVGPAAVPALLGALDATDPSTRWEAAKALSTIADPSAVMPFVVALDDEDASVRWLAAEGLSRIGFPALAPLLHALIEHSGSAWLRHGAYHVLRGNLNDELAPALTPVLGALTGHDAEITVMPAASRAIKMLESGPPGALLRAPLPEWHASRLPSMTRAHGTWRNLRFQG